MAGLPSKYTVGGFAAAAAVLLLGALVWFHFFSMRGVTRERQWSSQSADPGPVLFTPDGKTLVSASKDAVRLWDPRTGKLRLTLPAQGTTHLSISPDGALLGLVQHHRGTARKPAQSAEICELATGTRIALIEEPIIAIAFSPAGPHIATTTAEANAPVQLRTLPDAVPLRQFLPTGAAAVGLAFSPDGKRLAIAQTGGLELFDIQTGKSIRRLVGPATALFSRTAFSPDGKAIAATVGFPGPPPSSGVWTWDVTTGEPKVQLDFGHPSHDAAFSADGSTLAVHLLWFVMNRKERIDVYDLHRGRRTHLLRVRKPWMWSVALSPDARHLAVGFQRQGYDAEALISLWRLD